MAEPPRRGDAEAALDAAWRDIVAGFDQPVDRADPPWPRAEEVPGDAPAQAKITLEKPEPSLLDGLDTFGATLPSEDEEDGYHPPPPPPLPRISLAAGVGVAAIAFGLLLFVWPDLLPMLRNAALLLGFGSVVTGFATLICRLRPGDDEDEYDDGARV